MKRSLELNFFDYLTVFKLEYKESSGSKFQSDGLPPAQVVLLSLQIMMPSPYRHFASTIASSMRTSSRIWCLYPELVIAFSLLTN